MNNSQTNKQVVKAEWVDGGNVYVSPKSQLSEKFAMNANVDLDVVLVEGCNPVDDITQVNAQGQDQGISSDLSSSLSGTVIIPADQRADKFAYNLGVNKDVIMPVLWPNNISLYLVLNTRWVVSECAHICVYRVGAFTDHMHPHTSPPTEVKFFSDNILQDCQKFSSII